MMEVKWASITFFLSLAFHKSSEDGTLQILENLVREHATGCEVLIASQDLNSSAGIPFFEIWEISGGTYILEVGTSHLQRFRKRRDLLKLNEKRCGVALISLEKVSVRDGVDLWLFEAITPRYMPLLKKDQDLFVFICQRQEDVERLLLGDRFGGKIRSKVALLNGGFKGVDLYGEGGSSEVVDRDPKDIFPEWKLNFHGNLLRVAVPNIPSYFEMILEESPLQIRFKGLRGLYKMWLDEAQARFNFTTYLFHSSGAGSTGKQLPNGTWVGSVAHVLEGEADLAAYNGHIYNRHRFVEWSAPVSYEWMVFLIRKPKAVLHSASTIVRPFPMELWLEFLFILLILIIFLRLTRGRVAPQRVTLYLVASFLEQDSEHYLKFRQLQLSHVRITLGCWLLFAMVLSTVYRGRLVGLIAFPEFPWVPSTWQGLADSNFSIGLNVLGKGGAIYTLFSTSDSPLYQKLFSKMNIFADGSFCLEQAYHYDWACIMGKSISDYLVAKDFSDKFGRTPFITSKETGLFRADGYIWEKRAIFRKEFNLLTWSILETGLSSRWFQSDLRAVKKKRLDSARSTHAATHYSLLHSSSTSAPGGPSALKLVHFIGILYVFICGILYGLFTLFFEWFWNLLKRKCNVYFGTRMCRDEVVIL